MLHASKPSYAAESVELQAPQERDGLPTTKNMTAATQKITRGPAIKSTARPTSTARGKAAQPALPAKPLTKANLALKPQVASAEAFANDELRKVAFYADDHVLILNMDVREAMAQLHQQGEVQAGGAATEADDLHGQALRMWAADTFELNSLDVK